METAIRWSPSSTTSEQRFLLVDVNGRTIKILRVSHYDGKELHFETLSTARKVPQFRALDWSSKDEDVVAVGQWSGETTVLRMGERPHALHLIIKHQRLCNAVAFNSGGLLATGLERVRNDFCLNVWDVSQRLLTTASSKPEADPPPGEPLRKLASSEAITSIKFFNKQPESLVCGVKGACVRIYDLRDNTGNASLQFQTSQVHNIAIDPMDENYFASAGPPKDTTVQVWDRRWGPVSTAANLGSGGAYQPQSVPILELQGAFDSPKNLMAPSIWSLRFCKGKRGYLGALASTGDFKIFEMNREYAPKEGQYDRNSDYMVERSLSYPPRIIIRRTHHVERAYDDAERGRQINKRIVAFDFTNLAGSNGRPCAITLRGDQNIDIYELNGPPSALTVSPIGGLVATNIKDGCIPIISPNPNSESYPNKIVRVFNSSNGGKISDALRAIRPKDVGILPAQRSSGSPFPLDDGNVHLTYIHQKSSLSSGEAHDKLHEFYLAKDKLNLQDALSTFDLTRRRCAEGYLFDCKQNAVIVNEDPWLEQMWLWIDRAKYHASEVMITETLDLSYLGVFSIWNNDLGSREVARRSSTADADVNMADAITFLSKKLQLPQFSIRETAFPMHRQLCLYTCGLGLTNEQLEHTIEDLIRHNQNTRAAVLAMIHGRQKLALRSLRSGTASQSHQSHRELSLALAGYSNGMANEDWVETLTEVAKGRDDPYAHGILALVRSGDWHDVLTETSLPLKYRIGIALMYLDDQELTQYIAHTTADCIKLGDIEGIVLTGLTEKTVPLFETYITKFSDYQTAILAISFASPRYFTDFRVDTWREVYRTTLNTYRMFIRRVHFDVQSTKLSTPPNQKPLLPPAPRQISLRCNNCDQSLNRNPEHNAGSSTGSNHSFTTNHPGSIFGDAKSGTVCPKCGRHMPRCVICMMWLGMPDPRTRGGAVAGEKGNPMKDFISVCRGCWHMSHGAHAQEWFAEHEVCPVPDCQCRCAEVDAGIRFRDT